MGVKAVFGVVSSRVMCFGSRGDLSTAPKRHYQAASSVAEKAMEQRWLITIGGGADVAPEFRGRALNLVAVSNTYGETAAFVQDAEERARLAQWPVAVALRDVYDIAGYPHLVSDLGFEDLRILENAFDQVVRPEPKIHALWSAIQDREVALRDLPPIIGFNDENKLTSVASLLPGKTSGEEGKRLRKEASILERDPGLAQAAKRANDSKNGGRCVCEGCGFANVESSLFDAHHLVPLSIKVRRTVLSDFAVLCPTCHRICHRFGPSEAQPLPIVGVRSWWSSQSLV